MALINNPTSMKGPAEAVHGWMLVGFAFNVLLMGVMVSQIYMYYTKYRDDRTWIKALVSGIFILDVINTAFLFAYLYRCLITFFGDIEYLSKTDWILATDAWTTGVIACAVQLFFAWRILVLTKNRIYVVIIAALSLAGCGAAIAVPIKTGNFIPVSEFHKISTAVTIWLACEVAADVVITAVLVWYLVSFLRRKHKTGFRRSDMMVDRIIRVTLQTGLLTMVVASVDLFFFLADPTGTHFLFNFTLAKLYTNSLMSSLNSRHGWKFNDTTSAGTGSESQVNTTGGVKSRIHMSNMKKTDIEPNMIRTHPAEVFVHVEQHELRDVKGGDKFDENPHALHSQSSVEISVDGKKWGTDKDTWA
ncbi:hypothetical protein NLJ89_g4605 [Agrocybe chaxingu]|uniref:DUF6534 domain-containing protein n=1 Tax=Agrocybe chaxingu TaxID=84603 RepID=A0A9W8K2G6_9AGAR|nr:hypothetical protein NLJ89_g4605 [Agrocybe chaxingu]